MNNVTFTVPQRGEKKHLLDLSVMNVKQYKVDRLKTGGKVKSRTKKRPSDERNPRAATYEEDAEPH